VSNPPTATSLDSLVGAIRRCRICSERPLKEPLANDPRPILQISSTAKLLIAGQAPGVRAHRSRLPFDDPSGDRLRAWMGVDRAAFYDESRIAIVPMGFCFPGLNTEGYDLPPRRECVRNWHDALFEKAPQIETILAIGRSAQDYHLARLGHRRGKTESVNDTVARWRDFVDARPRIMPLPHPSWRNSGWLKRNPWFAEELLPALRACVAAC
jgi:uracil-DNA glycosylase